MWHLYRHPLHNPSIGNGATVGTLVSIYLSTDKKLIKRVYNPEGLTVSKKKPTIKSASGMNRLFQNELFWLENMSGSDFVPKLIDYNEEERSIVQEFAGTDLYTLLSQKQQLPLNISSQLEQMYHEYREKKLFKGNGDPRNLAIKNGRVLAFDFKWAKPRSREKLSQEWSSIRHFMGRIQPGLLYRLKKTFSDFPEEQINLIT